MNSPLLAFFGDDDPYIPQADVDELRSELAQSGRAHEVVVVPGAGHAFMNDTREASYRPEAAAAAFDQSCEFLRVHLTDVAGQ